MPRRLGAPLPELFGKGHRLRFRYGVQLRVEQRAQVLEVAQGPGPLPQAHPLGCLIEKPGEEIALGRSARGREGRGIRLVEESLAPGLGLGRRRLPRNVRAYGPPYRPSGAAAMQSISTSAPSASPLAASAARAGGSLGTYGT